MFLVIVPTFILINCLCKLPGLPAAVENTGLKKEHEHYSKSRKQRFDPVPEQSGRLGELYCRNMTVCEVCDEV